MPTLRHRRAPLPRASMMLAAAAWKNGDFHGLNRAFGIRPWQVSPFDVDGLQPPAWSMFGPAWHASWPRAWELRRQLIELAGAPGRCR